MKRNRILTAILLLAACVAGLWFAFQMVQQISNNEREKISTSEFSETRRQADSAFEMGKWDQAIEFYEQMLIADPFDGEARIRKAWCELKFANQIEKSTEANIGPTESNSPETEQSLRLIAEAKEDLEVCLDSPFHRNLARRNLAQIAVREGRQEDAIQLLDEAVKDGYATNEGIENLDDFESLLENSKLEAVLKKEQLNRGSMYRRVFSAPPVN